jgi:Domain of unknown function (DUF4868)
MSDSTASKLKKLHKTNFSSWHSTLWLVKRNLESQIANYKVMRIDAEEKLLEKLKASAVSRITKAKYQLQEYDFVTVDQDESLLTISVSETDFAKINNEIKKGLNNAKATKAEDLKGAWAYVLQLTLNGQTVFALRKISRLNTAAKLSGLSALFDNKKLIDIEGKTVFALDTKIDFFVFDDVAFITDKKGFESALNFRVGMEKNRDAVLDALSALNVFDSVEPIRKKIGSNLSLLRKISVIQKNKYYEAPGYLAKLIELNEQQGWGLVIKDGIILVSEDNVELVLKLLNNDRLASLINDEVFDATVKKKVG